jgi:hypothetical protein
MQFDFVFFLIHFTKSVNRKAHEEISAAQRVLGVTADRTDHGGGHGGFVCSFYRFDTVTCRVRPKREDWESVCTVRYIWI